MLQCVNYINESDHICVSEVIKVDNKNKGKSLGEIIRYERKSRNITLEELASKLNISPTYLGLIEMGKRGKNINSELLVSLAYVFDLSTDYLLGVEEAVQKKGGINADNEDYKKLLSLYKMMEEKQREQLIAIAHVLID